MTTTEGTAPALWPAMNPGQRALVTHLRYVKRPQPASVLAGLLDIATDAMTKRLKVLAERGIVAKNAKGQWYA